MKQRLSFTYNLCCLLLIVTMSACLKHVVKTKNELTRENSTDKDSVITDTKIILRNLNLKSFPKVNNPEKIEIIDVSYSCTFPDSIERFKNLRVLKAEWIFEETCHNIKNRNIRLNKILNLIKLEEVYLTGHIDVDYIYERDASFPHLKKFGIQANHLPISLIQSSVKDIGHSRYRLLSTPEMENLSTIYTGRFDNSGVLTKYKITIPKNGMFKNYYSNNQKLVEGNFVGAKPDGKWAFWFANGKLSQKRYYDHGMEIGKWFILNEKGDSLLIETFVNGKLDTWDRRYFDSDSAMGQNKIFFYSDSTKRYSIGYYWQGDKKISSYKSTSESWVKETGYYKNKNKNVEITYKIYNLLYHGPYTIWYEDGKLKEERNYKDGKLNGEVRYWNPWGILYQIDTYIDDKLIKTAVQPFDNK